MISKSIDDYINEFKALELQEECEEKRKILIDELKNNQFKFQFLIHTFSHSSEKIQEYMTHSFFNKSNIAIDDNVIRTVAIFAKSQDVFDNLISAVCKQLSELLIYHYYSTLSEDEQNCIQNNKEQFKSVTESLKNSAKILSASHTQVKFVTESLKTLSASHTKNVEIENLKDKFYKMSVLFSSTISYVFSIFQTNEVKKYFIDRLKTFGGEFSAFVKYNFNSSTSDIQKYLIKSFDSTDNIRYFIENDFSNSSSYTQNCLMVAFFPVDKDFNFQWNKKNITDLSFKELETLVFAESLKYNTQKSIAARFKNVPDLERNDLLNYYNNCKTLESQQSFMNTIIHYRKNYKILAEIFNKSSEETQKWMIDGLIQQLNKNDYEKIPAKNLFLQAVFDGNKSLSIQAKLIEFFESLQYDKCPNTSASKYDLFRILLSNCSKDLYDKLEKTIPSINIAMYESMAYKELKQYRTGKISTKKPILMVDSKESSSWKEYNQKNNDNYCYFPLENPPG